MQNALSSSSGIRGSCTSCAADWPGSSATSAARSKSGRARGGVRTPAWPGRADPLAAAAPARWEALFFPGPEVECIGNGGFSYLAVLAGWILPCLVAKRLSPLMAACSSLASVGKLMALGCTVVSTVTHLKSWLPNAPGLVRHS